MAVNHAPRILAIDAGGTMTDTFIIDDGGEFVVGKAQTTPEDESVAVVNSSRDALRYWSLEAEEVFPGLVSGIYSGTAMLNRLLSRRGRKVGLIVTYGHEDYLRLERGIQTYLGYSYSDRLHLVTHRHNQPLVPRRLIKGVRERIDVFGKVAIPLYDHEVRQAAGELLDHGVESICINFIYSYRNPAHELRAQEIAQAVVAERGVSVPVFISAELYPMRRDFPRLNTLLIEAYAAEPSRDQLRLVRDRVRKLGGKLELRVMASHGGTISVEAKQLCRTLVSGPIGGVIGAKYLVDQLGGENIVCTDVGGTSFDLALITGGEYQMKNNPDIARFLLNLPMVQIDSVGAGTGTFVRINPVSNRIELGPDSAGYRVGVCNPIGGIETVTISDCHVALGLMDPNNFLGGDVKLDRERALATVESQVAKPLGLDVFEAAAGVVQLFEDSLRNQVVAQVLGKGYTPEGYTLLSYGGGGPLHVAGYTEGLNFEDVLIPAWAAGFSAFGCACADFEYRYDKTIDLPVTADAGVRAAAIAGLNQAWVELRQKVVAEFAKSGVPAEQVSFRNYLRIQYLGQLNDLEIRSRNGELADPTQLQEILDDFEGMYGKVYARAAKSPELGYLVTSAIATGTTQVEKPKLPDEPLAAAEPAPASRKGERQVYWRGEWVTAQIYDMDKLQAGNRIAGMAIIESPSTTFVVPPDRFTWLDHHRIFHLGTVGRK